MVMAPLHGESRDWMSRRTQSRVISPKAEQSSPDTGPQLGADRPYLGTGFQNRDTDKANKLRRLGSNAYVTCVYRNPRVFN